MNKKIIAVIGATGQQGSGLVHAILNDADGEYAARALTRDPAKEAAVTLKEAGAEVVKFDMDDPSTHAAAFNGCYGVFCVTNFWDADVLSAEKEKAQAVAVAESCKKAGVKHIIWSTQEGCNEFFDSLPENERPDKIDGYYMPHFEGKHQANEYFPAAITTLVYTSCYYEILINFGLIQNGTLRVNMGNTPLAIIATSDIGKCCFNIFKAGDKYKGESVYLASDLMSCADIMNVTSQVTETEFRYEPLDREAYASLGFPGANHLANMFYYKVKNPDFNKRRDPSNAKEIYPDMISYKDWLQANKEAMSKLAA